MLKATLAALPLLATSLCAGDETVSGYADRTAVYHLVEINGQAAPAPATIRFPAEGRIAGHGPCNTYSAAQTEPYPWLSIERIAATRRACPDLSAESMFFVVLRSMTLAEVTQTTLILTNEDGAQMVFQTR